MISYVAKRKVISSGPTGDLFALQELSDYPAAFTEVDSKGWYPIHRAAVQQSVQVLEMVLYGELFQKNKKLIPSNFHFGHNIARYFDLFCSAS